MAVGYVLVALLASVVAVFAVQNPMPVHARFLVWTLPEASVAALVLVTLAIGVVLAGLPLWLQRWRLRARVRALERQVRQLETALDERNRAMLAQRPSSEAR
jgi:uncharacterized integral membrane protein